MEVVSASEFFKRTMGGRRNKIDTTYYQGHEYECGCGRKHIFSHETTDVIRELGGMKLVIHSKQCDFVNCVKIKGWLRFKGFNTLFSAINEINCLVNQTN